MQTQQHKVFFAFESEEGDQINYYFTDAKTEELAEVEAKKQAVKFFNLEEPKIKRLEDTFQGLPEEVPELYTWFVGSKDMFSKPDVGLEAATDEPEQKESEIQKAEHKKATTTHKKAAAKKSSKKK